MNEIIAKNGSSNQSSDEPAPITLLEKKIKGHRDWIRSVAVSPDGKWVVSGSNDKTIKLWDLEAGTCQGTFEGHQKKIHSVAISPDGTLTASTGFTGKTMRIWDLKSGACLQVIKDEEDPFRPISVAFSPDGSLLVAGTADGDIYSYCLTGVKAVQPIEAGERYTNAKVVLVGESGVYRVRTPTFAQIRRRSSTRPALRVLSLRETGDRPGGRTTTTKDKKRFHLLRLLR
jgi:WD40 repeat protein